MKSIKDIHYAADATVQVNWETRRLSQKTQSLRLMCGGDIERAIFCGRIPDEKGEVVTGVVRITWRQVRGCSQLHVASQYLSWAHDVEDCVTATIALNREGAARFDAFGQMQGAGLGGSQRTRHDNQPAEQKCESEFHWNRSELYAVVTARSLLTLAAMSDGTEIVNGTGVWGNKARSMYRSAIQMS